MYYVNNRYSPGSPAMVGLGTAMRVADDERRGYADALEGVYGLEAQARAKALGLVGIVEKRVEVRNGWRITDLLTGDEFIITDEQAALVRDLRRSKPGAFLLVLDERLVYAADGAGNHTPASARTALKNVRELHRVHRLRLKFKEGREEHFVAWERWEGAQE